MKSIRVDRWENNAFEFISLAAAYFKHTFPNGIDTAEIVEALGLFQAKLMVGPTDVTLGELSALSGLDIGEIWASPEQAIGIVRQAKALRAKPEPVLADLDVMAAKAREAWDGPGPGMLTPFAGLSPASQDDWRRAVRAVLAMQPKPVEAIVAQSDVDNLVTRIVIALLDTPVVEGPFGWTKTVDVPGVFPPALEAAVTRHFANGMHVYNTHDGKDGVTRFRAFYAHYRPAAPKPETVAEPKAETHAALEDKIVVDIDSVFRMQVFRRHVNGHPLENIVFAQDGRVVEFAAADIARFKVTGLSNVDFILSGFADGPVEKIGLEEDK